MESSLLDYELKSLVESCLVDWYKMASEIVTRRLWKKLASWIMAAGIWTKMAGGIMSSWLWNNYLLES